MTDYGEGLRPGTRIGEFEIERELGSGGFGVTYLARDLQLGRRVAVKEYMPLEWGVRRADGAVGPRASTARLYSRGLERFLDEARVLARLDHRGIVKVLRVVPDAETAYIVMEYVKGHSLAAEVQSAGPLPEARMLPILEGMAEGLGVVHAADILHQDLKPENVMLRESDGSPVLIDFGAARQEMSKQSRSLMGQHTPGYAPIEQGSETGRRGSAADLYALGAVAYAALSGRIPKPAGDRVMGYELPPVEEVAAHPVSPVLARAVMAALAVFPEDRPQTVGEWLEMLGRRPVAVPAGGGASGVVVGSPGVQEARRQLSAPRRIARPEPSAEGPKRASRRPWAWAAVGVGATAVLALLWVAVAGRGGGDPRSSAEPAAASPESSAAADSEQPPPAAPDRDSLARVIEEALGLNSSEAQLVQRGLREAGFDPGADCSFKGGGRCDALVQWQAVRGMEGTGFLGSTAFDSLRNAGVAAELADSAARAQQAAREQRAAEAQRLADLRRPGRRLSDCNMCPDMVVIGPGTFMMGSPWPEAGRSDNEGPRRYVTIARSFALLGVTEVTFNEWDACARGGVWEWTQDCWHSSYEGTPNDGRAARGGDCSQRVLRGGSYMADTTDIRSARRAGGQTGRRGVDAGFRVARTIP